MARILVVDDDPNILEIVRYVTTKAGHECLEASDGQKGLDSAKADHPDLIILDVMMPEIDGYTLHNYLLAEESTKRIPIIILTAKGYMRDTFAGSPNIKFYMDKPFEPATLQDNIRICLQGKK